MTTVVDRTECIAEAASEMTGRPCIEPGSKRIGCLGSRLGVIESVSVDGTAHVRFEGRSEDVSITDVVPLPRVGERVTVPVGEGVLCGYWLAVEQLDATSERVTVRLLEGSVVAEHTLTVDDVHATRVVTSGPEPVGLYALDALAQSLTRQDQLLAEHEAWKRRLSEDACREADAHDWCGEVEAFMDRWGLQGRERSYTVDVLVTARAYIAVDALDEQLSRPVDRSWSCRGLGWRRDCLLIY